MAEPPAPPAAEEKAAETVAVEKAPPPEGWDEAFKDQEYDAIILGTGMKECLISGLLSKEGKKVLHLDRNQYYGGDCASLEIWEFYKKFGRTAEPVEGRLGKLRDFHIDLMPKFMMASGNLVKALVKTGVSEYMEFKPVDGSYVYRRGQIHAVPTQPKEAMSSPLMGMMEKTRAVQFFAWVNKYDAANPRTHTAGTFSKTTLSLPTMTSRAFFAYWKLEQDTIDFIGHALALFQDDQYLDGPASVLVERIQLYKNSLLRFEGMTAPYIYPLYGLGELPQSFARLAAVYGGTYMLGRDIDRVVVGDDGVACGVEADGLVAKANWVIGDPSYFPDRVRPFRKVVRAIAIINHGLPGTNNCPSAQVIFPQNQIGRASDVYVFCCSASHKVAPEGTFIAFASTTVEGDVDGLTAQQVAERELAAALPLIAPVSDIFFDMYEQAWPERDGRDDHVVISKSYDPTSHFETAMNDVMDMYARIPGKPLDLSAQ